MDDRRFDAMARDVSRRFGRRGALGVVVAAMVAVAIPGTAEAGRCKTDSDCDGCTRCDRRKKRCVKGCSKGKACCGGACVDPKECCDRTADCGKCERCVDGRCRPDRSRNGEKCSGCLECVNGACGLPNDEFCKRGEKCRAGSGICCPKCLDGKCCPPGAACINPSLFSENFCCDTTLNTPCGSNGDGTYEQCCINATERCVEGECKPKDECPSAQLTDSGLCCDKPEQVCAGAGGEEYCCTSGKTCCKLHYGGEVCCDKGRCLEPGLCCAPDAVVKCSGEFAHCSYPNYQCCGEYSCADCDTCRVEERLFA